LNIIDSHTIIPLENICFEVKVSTGHLSLVNLQIDLRTLRLLFTFSYDQSLLCYEAAHMKIELQSTAVFIVVVICCSFYYDVMSTVGHFVSCLLQIITCVKLCIIACCIYENHCGSLYIDSVSCAVKYTFIGTSLAS